MFHLGDKTYRIVHEYKDAWNPEAFRDRYSEVLDRYDYIMGDWGYNQLRLKGFFKEGSAKASKETTIAGLQDYLNEYCNFGCAYFLLERIPSPNRPPDKEDTFPPGSGHSTADSSVRTGAADGNGRSERPEHQENRHRFDPGTRKDQSASSDVPVRVAHNPQNVSGQPDQAKRANTTHHRGKDRVYRGGSGRPDKPSGNRSANGQPKGSFQ